MISLNHQHALTVPVSPLFRFPTADNTYDECWLSEGVTWPRFLSTCRESMLLREDFEPRLAWKFGKGPGSKDWVRLKDEESYKRMMGAGVARVRADAKKTGEKARYGKQDWWIAIKTLNRAERVETEGKSEEDEVVPEPKEKGKKRKGKLKEKKPKKRKRRGKKAPFSPSMIFCNHN